MKRVLFFTIAAMVVAVSCQREVVYNEGPCVVENEALVANTNTRSYDEALSIAEGALKVVEGDDTRSTIKRVIMRNDGQTVMRPVTRGSEVSEEPIMYVFNNEDNQGFTIVAADRTLDPIIAVTENGSYTYGEPTGVEAFDAYMTGIEERLVVTLPPVNPMPGYIIDTVRYNYTNVGPLLKTMWGQGGVYARETMLGTIGCGPLAVAQVMAFHQYPSTLELTYMTPSTTIALNWTDILKHTVGEGENPGLFIGNYLCDCGCDYIAMSQLLREVGERAGIDYGYDANYGGVDIRITMDDARSALRSLGYNATKFAPLFPGYQFYYSDMLADLRESRPVLLNGYDSSLNEGHIWVADGYYYKDSELDYYVLNPNYQPLLNNGEPQYIYDHTAIEQHELVHFNWGWNGMCNGWFNLEHFESDNASIYDNYQSNNDADTNFCYSIKLIYDIYPNM